MSAVDEERELGDPGGREGRREEKRPCRGDPPGGERPPGRPPHPAVEIDLGELVERARSRGDEGRAEERVDEEEEVDRASRPRVPAANPTKAVRTTKSVMRGFVSAT